jgi:regulator of protease activity HflC (stomatin/prohibitin superfamily)
MEEVVAALSVFAVAAVVLVIGPINVPQSHVVVVERFGRYTRTLSAGLRFYVRGVEGLVSVSERGWGDQANKRGRFIELTEQQSDTGPRQAQTKDNVTLQVDAVVYWRIVDVRRAIYDVDVLTDSTRDVALNVLRVAIGRRELDEVTSERKALGDEVLAELARHGRDWGVRFTRVDIQEIDYDDSTASAMRQQMEAERRRRALVSESLGKAESERLLAEAQRDADLLRAEGQAAALELLAAADSSYLKSLAEVVGRGRAAELLLAQRTLQSYEAITDNPAHKVFLPSSVQPLVGDGFAADDAR